MLEAVSSHFAESHFANFHFAESHFAESHFAESHFAESHFAESHFAESHFAESHFAESHFAESHFAESHFAESRLFIVAPVADGFIEGHSSRPNHDSKRTFRWWRWMTMVDAYRALDSAIYIYLFIYGLKFFDILI